MASNRIGATLAAAVEKKVHPKAHSNSVVDFKHYFNPRAGYCIGIVGDDDQVYFITHIEPKHCPAAGLLNYSFMGAAEPYALFDFNVILNTFDITNPQHIQEILALIPLFEKKDKLQALERAHETLISIYFYLKIFYPDLKPDDCLNKEIEMDNQKIVINQTLFKQFNTTTLEEFVAKANEAVAAREELQSIINDTKFAGQFIFDRTKADKNLSDTALRELNDALLKYSFQPHTCLYVRYHHTNNPPNYLLEQNYCKAQHIWVDSRKKYCLKKVIFDFSVMNRIALLLSQVHEACGEYYVATNKFIQSEKPVPAEITETYRRTHRQLVDELDYAINTLNQSYKNYLDDKPHIIKSLEILLSCLEYPAISLVDLVLILEFFRHYGTHKQESAASLNLIKMDDLFALAAENMEISTHLSSQIVALETEVKALSEDPEKNAIALKIQRTMEKLKIKQQYMGFIFSPADTMILVGQQEAIRDYVNKRTKTLIAKPSLALSFLQAKEKPLSKTKKIHSVSFEPEKPRRSSIT